MASQALYLKYRPLTFEEVVDQEPITITLRNALRQGRLRHAYLLSGPRGTGKTTVARLLAKAANCQAPEAERPCNQCPTCTAVNEGRLLDLIEIDAASNRGIDEIRDIREKVSFRPSEGRYKVYVLDEAHMLTDAAFNALLKTLEEPPPHVIFALVTTEPHKIPATIASRCQRFDFRRLPLSGVVGRLQDIADREGISVEPDALELIARQGSGALRDAISLLDQLASYGDDISVPQVQMVLGTVASEAAGQVVACLADGDMSRGLDIINRAVDEGANPRQFGRDIVEYLRGLLLLVSGADSHLLKATAEQAEEMEALARRIPEAQLPRFIRFFNDASSGLKGGIDTLPQLPLEMALVESILASRGSRSSEAIVAESAEKAVEAPEKRQPAATQAATPSLHARPGTPEQPTAGDPGPSPTLDQSDRSQGGPAVEASDAAAVPVTGPLTLEVVRQSWGSVLTAVRKRNPATQGVLNSGCRPVEVLGNEVIVSYPFSFLGEKLSDAQRWVEIQDSFGEVFGFDCHVKLVLASDYVPAAAGGEPPQIEPAETAPARPDEAAGAASDGGHPPSPTEAQAYDQISAWAEKHGGHTSLVSS